MGFFDDAIKALDGISQDIGKHASYAAADVGRALSGTSQEVKKQIPPSTLQYLERFGEEAGKHVGATTDDIWKSLLSAREEIGKHVGPAAEGLQRKLDMLVQEAGKHFGDGVEDAKRVDWESSAGDMKDWIEKHPGLVAGIAAGIIAPPVAIAAVPVVLGGFGFTAGGVAAGSFAAGAQAAVGNVAAGSLFATLQGAAMGGGSAALVNGVVGATVAVTALGANMPGIIDAVNEGKPEQKEEEKEEL